MVLSVKYFGAKKSAKHTNEVMSLLSPSVISILFLITARNTANVHLAQANIPRIME